jgi:hypothetical protein
VNRTAVTVEGLVDVVPGREALPGSGQPSGRPSAERERHKARRRKRPPDEFRSYYGLPVINQPVWEAREIAGYFFLGGLAGASSCLALGAQLSGRPGLARVTKVGAAAAAVLSMGALVKDLGRSGRFLNMLRVFKPTSPMSVGTWVLAGYVPATLAAAASGVSGRFPGVGLAATSGAAALGPAVASYTGALIANTAVPAWHDARRYLPPLFAASAAMAGAGLSLAAAPGAEVGPARRLAVAATGAELLLERAMATALEPEVGRAYEEGLALRLLRASKVLAVTGAVGAIVGGRRGTLRRASGVALMASSACTRFGVFHAGMASARDPVAIIAPQKARAAK